MKYQLEGYQTNESNISMKKHMLSDFPKNLFYTSDKAY